MKLLSLFDRLPNLYGKSGLLVAAGISSLITVRLCLKAGVHSIWPAAIALPVVILIAWGWTTIKAQLRPTGRVLGLMAVLALPFVVTAVFMGSPRSGGFPAAMAMFFGIVVGVMHNLQTRLLAQENIPDDLPVHALFHREFGWISAVLFVFGVMTLWPWLGELYGDAYFWILILGVLVPMLFFWGRLRQPRHEGLVIALHRFDRLLPYIGFIFLLAIAVG